MKKMILAVMAAMAVCRAGAFTIENVTARQRLPWNELVDVEFEISGGEADAKYVVDLTATSGGGSQTYRAKSFKAEPIATTGSNRVTWDLGTDYPGIKATDFEISVTAKTLDDTDGVYCVIDVSGGKDASSYPVRYTTTAPAHTAYCTNDICKLTEIWLKRVQPNGRQFVVASNLVPTEDNDTFYTKLTKDYYLGIFEVTQQQWAQLTGNWPSRMSNETWRATRPLDLYYPYLFFGSNNYNWPDIQTPAEGSVWYKLRTKTGLAGINLPTEAQWTFAAMAGAATGQINKYYLKPDGTEYTIDEIARHSRNGGSTEDGMCDFQSGSAPVGCYQPNLWGFYDMVGNVSEDCLDPWVSLANQKAYYTEQGAEFPITDPVGLPQATAKAYNGNKLRAVRAGGGGYVNHENYQSIYHHGAGYLAYPGDGTHARGIRLCITCE